MKRAEDLTGRRFGRLVVLRRHASPGANPRWDCLCDCGNEKAILGGGLRAGYATSCGCRQREARLTHGLTYHPTYNSWDSMIQRCANPKTAGYENYGGRGVSVCAEWATFEGFLASMGLRPPGTSIDRIDPSGDYEPGNCRWATAAEQGWNRRTVGLLDVDEAEKRYLAGHSTQRIAIDLGSSPATVWRALKARGTPMRPAGRKR